MHSRLNVQSEPDDIDYFKEHIPELQRYKFPDLLPSNQLYVLKTCLENFRCEIPEARYYLNAAQEIMQELTQKCLAPAWATSDLTVGDVFGCLKELKRSSHPGLPAVLFAGTKGECVDNHLVDLVHAVHVRLICLQHVSSHCNDAIDYYNTFCSDLLCFSIKNEAIKVEKFGRAITSVSVVTQVIEKLVYGNFNKAFKASYGDTYSFIGIGFTQEDSDLLFKRVPLPVEVNDTPTFDFTVVLEELLDASNLAVNSYDSVNDRFRKVAYELEMAKAHKLFCLSSGEVYMFDKPGIQSTGCDQTANANTKIRSSRAIAAHLRVKTLYDPDHGLPNLAVVGDDCGETPHVNLRKCYEDLGFPLRDSKTLLDHHELCSHYWKPGEVPMGMRMYKSLYNLLVNDFIEDEQIDAFFSEYHKHEFFPYVITTISERRPEVKFRIMDFVYKNNLVPVYVENKPKKGKKKAVFIGPLPQNVQRRTVNKRKSRPSRKGNSMVSMEKICAISDPFCVAARGAKWPDAQSTRSVCIPVRGSFSVGTDANGNAARLMVPRWSTGVAAFSSITGTVATWSAMSAWVGTAAFSPQSVRLVSGGIKITNISPRLSAAGTLYLSSIPGGNSLNITTMDFADYGQEQMDTYTMSSLVDKSVFAFFKAGGNESRQFNPVIADTSTAVLNTYDWCPIVIGVTGAQTNTTVLRVEYQLNFELLFPRSDAMSLMGTPPPAADSVAAGGSSFVSSKIGSILSGSYEVVEKVFAQKAKQYLAGAAARAAGYALGGSAGMGAAGMITDYAMEAN